ncbi:MAG: DSD1 family PLP-dependent enzyme [Paucibacter sp.]|nr:DSD1 family PLP-dependent enzyme [Roseateles sp.]
MPLSLPPAARVGALLNEVDTPALLLDLAAFERNVARMQAAVSGAGLALRPHAKAHKTPAIALAQIAAGAVGVCCQKVSEALPFIAAGVKNIHISNEVGNATKATLLAEAARHAQMSVCADNARQIEWLAAATREAGTKLDVFVEIDIGQKRCGVAGSAEVMRLLDDLAPHGQLRFAGLQAYQGRVQHLRGHQERFEAARRASDRAAVVVAELSKAGVHCETVTGSGTGSVEFDLGSGVYTEIQAGSYVGMDVDYARNEYAGALRFEHALFLACRVMSQGDGTRAVVDAGLKSLAVDTGLPTVWGREADYTIISDEHGTVIPRSGPVPGLDELLLLVPGHCDPTFNLHNELVVFRDDRVEAIWPIAARGLSR